MTDRPSPDQQATAQQARRADALAAINAAEGALAGWQERLRRDAKAALRETAAPASVNALRDAMGQMCSAQTKLNSILRREKKR